MTINPVDMQVILPQTGQVSKIHRGLQFQQQTEQQILGQSVQQDMRQKEQSVQKMNNVEQTKIHSDKEEKRERGYTPKKRAKKEVVESKKSEEMKTSEDSPIGRILDLKV